MMWTVIIAGVVILAVVGFFFSPSQTVTPSGKVKVVASFYPLAEFARQVGGDRVEVINPVPAGVEPHDFEPSPKDIAVVYGAKLLVLNGAGLDAWAKNIRSSLEVRGVKVLEMAEHLDVIPSVEEEDGGSIDTHFWLDPVRAAREVELIRDALIGVDPAGADQYRENTNRDLAELMELDRAYRDCLASCGQKEIVTSHAAFGYLAKRYNITMVAIAGFLPEEEPSPKKLAEVATLVRRHGIRFIFMETLVNPKLAQTIANETGAGTLVFNPLEGLTDEEIDSGENYISIMQKNLENLRKALICR